MGDYNPPRPGLRNILICVLRRVFFDLSRFLVCTVAVVVCVFGDSCVSSARNLELLPMRTMA
jgi:hypothetical protein